MALRVRMVGWLAWCLVAIVCSAQVRGDVIPPGGKSVAHELVFVKSESLASHRLVAAPVRGFHGVTEIQAGQGFRFSTKYGTRFYLIPEDVDPLPEFDHELFAQWPSAEPPQSEITFVPITSPVASARTELRLADVVEGVPQIELVSHTEFDSLGKQVTAASYFKRTLWLTALGGALLVASGLAVRRLMRRPSGSP